MSPPCLSGPTPTPSGASSTLEVTPDKEDADSPNGRQPSTSDSEPEVCSPHRSCGVGEVTTVCGSEKRWDGDRWSCTPPGHGEQPQTTRQHVENGPIPPASSPVRELESPRAPFSGASDDRLSTSREVQESTFDPQSSSPKPAERERPPPLEVCVEAPAVEDQKSGPGLDLAADGLLNSREVEEVTFDPQSPSPRQGRQERPPPLEACIDVPLLPCTGKQGSGLKLQDDELPDLGEVRESTVDSQSSSPEQDGPPPLETCLDMPVLPPVVEPKSELETESEQPSNFIVSGRGRSLMHLITAAPVRKPFLPTRKTTANVKPGYSKTASILQENLSHNTFAGGDHSEKVLLSPAECLALSSGQTPAETDLPPLEGSTVSPPRGLSHRSPERGRAEEEETKQESQLCGQQRKRRTVRTAAVFSGSVEAREKHGESATADSTPQRSSSESSSPSAWKASPASSLPADKSLSSSPQLTASAVTPPRAFSPALTSRLDPLPSSTALEKQCCHALHQEGAAPPGGVPHSTASRKPLGVSAAMAPPRSFGCVDGGVREQTVDRCRPSATSREGSKTSSSLSSEEDELEFRSVRQGRSAQAMERSIAQLQKDIHRHQVRRLICYCCIVAKRSTVIGRIHNCVWWDLMLFVPTWASTHTYGTHGLR